MTLTQRGWVPCALIALALSGGRLWAQIPQPQMYDPVGVYVDAQGVLRSKTTDPDPRLSKLWAEARKLKGNEKVIFISLPRLLAEARTLQEAGKPLPDEVRYLGGMTKLQFVFVYPDAKDLVIAGPAEPIDAEAPYRPLGKLTGRPVLHLDDLVTALRAFAADKRLDRLGCDIQITKEVQERIAEKMKGIAALATAVGFKKAAEAIAEAGGQQPVKFYGMNSESRFAFVCVEADYRLKQLALGILPSKVEKALSYRALVKKPEAAHRFSLESNYEALLVSPDGNAFELKGPSLRVNSGLLGKPDSTDKDISAAALRFKELCNQNFAELCRHHVSWADLANIGDLSVLAALVATDGLAEKAGWDLSWAMKGHVTAKMSAPKSAATLCTYTMSDGMAIFVSGGVWINPAEWAGKRAKDEAVGAKSFRPEGDGWSLSRRP